MECEHSVQGFEKKLKIKEKTKYIQRHYNPTLQAADTVN